MQDIMIRQAGKNAMRVSCVQHQGSQPSLLFAVMTWRCRIWGEARWEMWGLEGVDGMCGHQRLERNANKGKWNWEGAV